MVSCSSAACHSACSASSASSPTGSLVPRAATGFASFGRRPGSFAWPMPPTLGHCGEVIASEADDIAGERGEIAEQGYGNCAEAVALIDRAPELAGPGLHRHSDA